MSYYWFNRQELLQKQKYNYHNCSGKEEAAKYYLENRGVLKENANNKYKKKKKKTKIKREYGKNRYRNMKEKQAKMLKK